MSERIDDLARYLAERAPRRKALALLAGAAGLGVREVAAKRHRRHGKRQRTAQATAQVQAEIADKFDVEEVDDVFVDASCDPPYVCTYGAMVAHVLTFAAHRRTLAVLALDKHGVGRLGWGDPITWIDADQREAPA